MREIDEGRSALPQARRRPGRLVAIIVATIAFAAFAGWLVAHSSGQRDDSSTAAVAPDDEVTQQLSLARAAAASGDASTAIQAYQRVLQLDPQNIEANTYAGWLIVTSGAQSGRTDFVDAGVAQLRHAIEIDTTYTDAHCLLGVALARFVATPDPVAATAELNTCLANDPPQDVRGLVEPVLASLGQSVTSARGRARPAELQSGVGAQASGGGQHLAETIVPSSSRRSTQVLALRQSGGEVSSQPRRMSASMNSGITSPWLHSTAPLGMARAQLEHRRERRALGQPVVGVHRLAEQVGQRLQGLHAAQVRAADQRGGVALGQPPGDGGGLSLAGLAQRAQLVVALPVGPRPCLGVAHEVQHRRLHLTRRPLVAGCQLAHQHQVGDGRQGQPDGDDHAEHQARIELLGHGRAPRSRCRSSGTPMRGRRC